MFIQIRPFRLTPESFSHKKREGLETKLGEMGFSLQEMFDTIVDPIINKDLYGKYFQVFKIDRDTKVKKARKYLLFREDSLFQPTEIYLRKVYDAYRNNTFVEIPIQDLQSYDQELKAKTQFQKLQEYEDESTATTPNYYEKGLKIKTVKKQTGTLTFFPRKPEISFASLEPINRTQMFIPTQHLTDDAINLIFPYN